MSSLHVTFRVGTAEYAVPAALVLHLEPFEAATYVPGAPSYVAGLVQVRGRVVPVVDLRKRFGLPPIDRTFDHRVVVMQLGTRVAGLLVDSAREVIQLDEASFQDAPELIKQQANGFVTGVVTVRDRLFLIVDLPRVIGQEQAS
ncbi:MAG: chemotaxis protein CheW [Deltaproteobacteria bacterium]|nr:MAG: chemotaxis protein CheW [Deltaproteobacteria bacterium]TMQ21136.1 MAG: chemotaxis protein CheW [Deltaproteobacteria bacterium]